MFDIRIIPTEAGWSSGAGSVSHDVSLSPSFQSIIIQEMIPLIIRHTD